MRMSVLIFPVRNICNRTVCAILKRKGEKKVCYLMSIHVITVLWVECRCLFAACFLVDYSWDKVLVRVFFPLLQQVRQTSFNIGFDLPVKSVHNFFVIYIVM